MQLVSLLARNCVSSEAAAAAPAYVVPKSWISDQPASAVQVAMVAPVFVRLVPNTAPLFTLPNAERVTADEVAEPALSWLDADWTMAPEPFVP